MRRTASEMLNELQVRVARLERQSSFDIKEGSLVKFDRISSPSLEVKEALLTVKRQLEDDRLLTRLSPYSTDKLEEILIRVGNPRQTGREILLQGIFLYEEEEDEEDNSMFVDIKVVGDSVKMVAV